MMSRSLFRRPIHSHLSFVVTAAVLITITACAQVRPATADGWQTVPAADRPPQVFLTLTVTRPELGRMEGALHQQLLKYPVESLQLRSIRDGGRVIRTLLRSVGQVDAVTAPDGTVIAALDYGCESQLVRIDPATGQRRLIRVVRDSVQDIALSPDGSRLAYDTVPKSQLGPCLPMRQLRHPVRIRINPGSFDISGPGTSVTAIVSLASGATVRTPDKEGNPAWSPNGTRIAVVGLSTNVVVQMSAANLHYLTAEQFRSPRGCGFTTISWTTSGLITTTGCNAENDSRRPYFDEASLAGKTLARASLPRCMAGVTTALTGKNVLVEADVGYGNGKPCGLPRPDSIKFLLLRGAGFTTVGTLPEPSDLFFLLGW
jgi:hypothetical protein